MGMTRSLTDISPPKVTFLARAKSAAVKVHRRATSKSSASGSLHREVVLGQAKKSGEQRARDEYEALAEERETQRIKDVLDPLAKRDSGRHLAMQARRAARRAIVEPYGQVNGYVTTLFATKR